MPSIFGYMMKKQAFLIHVLSAALLFMFSCDSLPEASSIPESGIALSRIIADDTLSFENANAIKDTTIYLPLIVEVADPELLQHAPVVSLYEKFGFQVVSSDTLKVFDPSTNQYSGTVDFRVSTGINAEAELVASATMPSGNPTNFLRKSFYVKGFSLDPPVVVQIISPDTVRLPSSGSISFSIVAEVTHPENRSFIKTVTVELNSASTGSLGIFQLFDDGSLSSIPEGGTSGDTIANDGFFTRIFVLSASNNPDFVTLIVKALDTVDQESNTLTKTLIITR
jgi:hypothetical protein